MVYEPEFDALDERDRHIKMLVNFLRKMGLWIPNDPYQMREVIKGLLRIVFRFRMWFLIAIMLMLLALIEEQICEAEFIKGLEELGKNKGTVSVW